MENKFSICLKTMEQLSALHSLGMSEELKNIFRIAVSADLVLFHKDALPICNELATILPGAELVLFLPEMSRMEDHPYFERVLALLSQGLFTGILSGNLESIAYFTHDKGKSGAPYHVYGDHNLYLWNSSAVKVWRDKLDGGCLPLELHANDQKALCSLDLPWEKIVYGRIPMMITANCIAKTNGTCRKVDQKTEDRTAYLKDRMGKLLPVRLECDHCHNVIYNSVPLSLHEEMASYPTKIIFRIQLTTENARESKDVLRFFLTDHDQNAKPPFADFTKGHEKKGTK